ncbi:MAG: SLC13 family permease [Actinomycetota bacterium]|nr:SLC13 family permease [Actinomycetota bacterium]
MSIEFLSMIVLIVMFVVATTLPINLGALAFVASFVVGTVIAGLSPGDVFGGFPVDLFVLLVGITLLFALAERNGTIDLITEGGLRLVRGNIGLIPWVMFGLTTVLCAAGALSAAGVAIVAPIALRYAARHGISPLLMGIMVVQGATAGSYSPISPFGVITSGVLADQDLPQNPGLLFVNSLIFNTLVAAGVFIGFGGSRLLRMQTSPEELSEEEREVTEETPAYSAPEEETSASSTPEASNAPESGEGGSEDSTEGSRGGLTPYKGATLAGIVALIVLALGFQVEVGFAAFTIALVLWMMAPYRQAEVLNDLPWSVILLISGILTYVGVLDSVGTIDYVEGFITDVGDPLLTALIGAYVGGIVSAFASTAGILGIALPLAGPVLEDVSLSAIGVVSAIAIASAIVDVSPLSTNGAILLANVRNVAERVFFRQLLLWAVFITAVGPPLAWLVFVVIGVP